MKLDLDWKEKSIKMSNFFDVHGYCYPSKGMRVFSGIVESTTKVSPNNYYKISAEVSGLDSIWERLSKHEKSALVIDNKSFRDNLNALKASIESDESYSNLFNGVAVPFLITPESNLQKNIGLVFEDIILQALGNVFEDNHPELNFKSVIQGGEHLSEKIKAFPNTGQDRLIEIASVKPVVGFYFPEVFKEYDIDSQRRQFAELPHRENLALSGLLDIAAALRGSPNLLINEEGYPPILCASGNAHIDERLIFLFKSYGHHLEFWTMSQMLTPGTKQVSEQFFGGLSFYRSI